MAKNCQKIIITKRYTTGIGFCGLLFIILLLLKVGVVETIVVGWSWWWITAPLWVPTCIVFGIIAFFFISAIICFLGGLLVAAIIDWNDKK